MSDLGKELLERNVPFSKLNDYEVEVEQVVKGQISLDKRKTAHYLVEARRVEAKYAMDLGITADMVTNAFKNRNL